MILNIGVLPCTSPDKIWPLMNAWLSNCLGLGYTTGLVYVSISKTSPPDGVSNCGYWLTVQMVYTVDFNAYIGKVAG